MILVLDTAIGLGVWIPFTIGKCVALLSVCLLALTNLLSASLLFSAKSQANNPDSPLANQDNPLCHGPRG